MSDINQIPEGQPVQEEPIKQPGESREFLSIYLAWMFLTYIFIIMGYSKFGFGAIFTPMLVIPMFAIVQMFIYGSLKRRYLLCRSSSLNKLSRISLAVLLCVIMLAPIIYYGFMAYSPGCGIPEMKKMVAEGTIYFEQNRKELYAEVENIAKKSDSNQRIRLSADWHCRSGQTFGGLYYDSNGADYNTSLGYSMVYPLDEYWFLSFFDGYN